MDTNYKKLSAATVAAKLKIMANEGKRLMIISHQNPDGDTVASAFAIKLIYEKLSGKKGLSRCVCPSEAAPYLQNFYSSQESILYIPGEEKNFDSIVTVDVASEKQMGKLQFLAPEVDMMIDHHALGESFADYYTVPEASAAGELVFEIYQQLMIDGMSTSPDIARLVYAAISADTGSFRYTNTTPETMNIAATLMREINSASDGGRDTAEIARILHENTTMSELKAQKLAIDNLKFAENGKIAYIIFTADMLEENSLTELDIGGIVDLPRSIEGVEIGITVKQNRLERTSYRVSSRSNGASDVARVCAVFGGGGHVKAAGATLNAPDPETAEKIIVEEFAKALRVKDEVKN